MMHCKIRAAVLGLLMAVGTIAPAAATPLDVLGQVMGTYNVFTFGDFGSATDPYSADSQAPMAIGGNAYFRDFNLAFGGANGVNALTVAGNLDQLRVYNHGNVFVGGNADFHDGMQGGATIDGTLTVNGTLVNAPTSYWGPPIQGPNPVDFPTLQASLISASSQIAAGVQGGTVGTVVYENQWNQKALMLNGTDANLNVFYLSGALLGQIGGVEADYSDGGGTFNFNVPIGSSVIINVDGVDVDFGHPGNFGFVCNGQDCAANAATNILFNFYQATTLQTQTVFGSILAPLADITFTNGYIAGSVIANSIGGPAYTTGEFHSELFAGRTSVPAPSAALVLILGLALCAASRKRVTLN